MNKEYARVNGRLVTVVRRITVGDEVRYLVRYSDGIHVIVTPAELDRDESTKRYSR